MLSVYYIIYYYYNKTRIMLKCIITKLTIQLFSNSVAVGLHFYRDREPDIFKDSVETEQFTLMLNSLFDAMNRKFPKEGIKRNSHDLEVFTVVLIK